MVVAFHVGLPVSGGFVGVDVFFVISGFVITAMLHREWVNNRRIRFGRFYLRRFKRLTPALALMVSVTMVISVAVLSPFGEQQNAAKTGIGSMLLVANLVIARTTGGYFDAPAESNPLLNTWSLSVEEQFYLVFPAILAFGWFLTRRGRLFRRWPFILVSTIAVVSFGLTLVGVFVGVFPGSSLILGFYSPFTRAWEFAVGALLALALARRTLSISSQLMTIFGAIGLILIASSLILITESTHFPGVWTLLPVSGTILLLLAGTDSRVLSSRFLSVEPMVKLGDWSYSIYLWHWPFIVFAAVLWPESNVALWLAAATSFIPALISYRWVEQPIRTRTFPSRRRVLSLVTITVVTPIACAVFLSIGARAAWWIDWSVTSQSTQDDHVALKSCTDQPFDPAICTWNADLQGGQVLLAGDSQAYAAADGVIEAAKSLNMSTVVSSLSGCPVSSLDTTGEKPLNCVTWQQRILGFALATKPKVVVIANRSTGYTNPGWRTVIASDGSIANTANTTEAVALYEDGLNKAVETLYQAGIGVVILQNIPEPTPIQATPSLIRMLFPPKEITTFDPERTLRQRSPVAQAEDRTKNTFPGTGLVDPAQTLCPDEECPLVIAGNAVYLDPWHLTRQGSLLLVPALRDAIRKAA